MLVSLNALKRYVDYGALSAEELAELITKSGIEVDGIQYLVSEKSENVVVGYVEECEKHPDADKLNICQVDVGTEKLQIICGAANVAKGQKVVVAKPGAVLPGNFKIKLVKLRGIESNGMICSLKELGVAEEHVLPVYSEGIIELPADAVVGESVTDLLNLDDAILEFDLTPNRADALNYMGVAYEVGAILDKEITLPNPEVETTEENVADYVRVASEDTALCSYYGAFIVKDVKVGPSPLWMQNYLIASGIRPISNVVDITNFVLLEYGQPLHAFDYDLLGTKEIIVRRAKQDEELVTLDGKTRVLHDDLLVITNGKEAVALAGVMGGANTEVNDATTTILLEAAHFDGQAVRRAVQHTGLRSEASTRFEKGVDPARVREAGLRACELLVTYAGGKLVDDAAVFDELDVSEKTVAMNLGNINKRLGTALTHADIADILRKLRFEFVVDGDNYSVTIPTRRGDIAIFEDMLEEVARMYGYDNLPYTLPENAAQPGRLTETQLLKRNVKKYLESAGLSEAITYSLTKAEDATKFVAPALSDTKLYPVKLAMPMSEDHGYLRQSLIPELLKCVTHNVARRQANVGLYEIGSVFLSEEAEITTQPREHARLAAVLTGTWIDHKWKNEKVAVDFYVAKGIVEGLFAYLNIDITFEQAKLADMHPGRAATVSVGDKVIGYVGQIHPLVAKEHDLKETFVFDLNMDYIFDLKRVALGFTTIPKHPANTRDIAFVVEQTVTAGDIKQAIEEAGAPLIKQVEAFDVYVGENVADNEKSIAFNLQFQDAERTLTDEEVDALFAQITEVVKEKFGGVVRS